VEVTVAVNVTDWPTPTEDSDAVRLVVVLGTPDGFTVTVAGSEVLVAWLPSLP
jgi:hypothetical protein